MEAVRNGIVALAVFLGMAITFDCHRVSAKNVRTKNFLVHAKDPALADAVASSAERFRDELAEYWLGRRLPDWPTPCPIEVVAGPQIAAQGATTYNRSPVGNFQMRVIGTPERILDSVLPHEVTHTVMATHFGRPLPRWADEGICTTVEHSAEKDKHEIKLREYLSSQRGLAMNRLFLLTEYPNDILPMYAQGYSVCRFLIQQSGPRKFIAFLEDYMRHPSWTKNVQLHYGYDSLKQLQDKWLAWVANGSGPVESFVSTRSKASGKANSNAVATRAEEPLPPTAVEPGLTVAASSGSWYERRRNQAASNPRATGTTATGTTATELIQRGSPGEANRIRQPGHSGSVRTVPRLGPPSVIRSGHYSVSQPQREQSFGQAAPLASSASAAPIYR